MQSQPYRQRPIFRDFGDTTFFQFVKEHNPVRGQACRVARYPAGLTAHFWRMVEDDGIEPTTPCLQSRCSPS